MGNGHSDIVTVSTASAILESVTLKIVMLFESAVSHDILKDLKCEETLCSAQYHLQQE